jgi:hypothetical protein
MLAPRSNEKLESDLAGLADASRQQLIERWSAAYGRPAPKGISRRLLEWAAAYELQGDVYGGLKPRVRRRLLSCVGDEQREKSTSSSRKLSPGTRLIREWNGRSHSVEVVDEGYVWNGGVYKSLSAVAHAITGARWSGPRFFGL